MKHNAKITIILIAMFIVTQVIGLFVVNAYLPKKALVFNETSQQFENVTIEQLPKGFQPPELKTSYDFFSIFVNIVIAFIVAIALMFLLSKIKITLILRIWFFIVVIIAIGLAINTLLKQFPSFNSEIFLGLSYSFLLSLIIAIPLAIYKIFKRNLFVHNLTELVIYPGIAAVFVSILNIWTAIIFLVLISAYDMWAVWKSKFMVKMAKFQMNEMKIFAGFFVPYMTKKVREQIAKLKKSKSKKKGKAIKISLAILGGGDVVFPIITAGVFLKFAGIVPALLVALGATLGLLFLFFISEKKKFYPAMPFITAGIFLALLIWRIFLY